MALCVSVCLGVCLGVCLCRLDVKHQALYEDGTEPTDADWLRWKEKYQTDSDATWPHSLCSIWHMEFKLCTSQVSDHEVSDDVPNRAKGSKPHCEKRGMPDQNAGPGLKRHCAETASQLYLKPELIRLVPSAC